MREWLKKWWWLTAVILAIALVIGWEEKRCQAQSYECRAEHTAELASVPANQKAAEQEAIAAACEPNGYFCRLFSAANLPTVFLVLIGVGGIWAALKSLEAIKQEVVLSQRPRVYVRNFYFTDMKGTSYIPMGITDGSLCQGQFYIVNSGGTPAYIQEVYCETLIAKFLPMKRPYEGKIGVRGTKAIAAGQSLAWTFAWTDPLSSKTVYDISENQIGFYVLGWIGYTDDLKIYRITSFCREYSHGKDRFVPVDNPDYEHSD